MINNDININDLNQFNKILIDINNNQKKVLTKIFEHLNNNSFIINDKKRTNKIKMLGILYATYLSTMATLEDKEIIDYDLYILNSICNNNENNDKILNFISLVKSLERLYSKLKENKNNKNENIHLGSNNFLQQNTLIMTQKKVDLLRELKSDNSIYEKPKMSTCIFCVEEYNENEAVNPKLECNNHVHGKCFINYIQEELNNNRFPIRCPICQNNNRHEINYKIILDCLLLNDKDNLAMKLETLSLNRLVETNPENVTFCPTASCSYMCFYDKNAFHLNCPLCRKSYCLRCKTEWHNFLTCEQYQMEKNNSTNEKKFEDFVKGNNFKQCPTCKRWVEKINGCDHITCLCGTHFCYRCGEIRDALNPYNHICPAGFQMINNLNLNNMMDMRFNNMTMINGMNNRGINNMRINNMNNMGINNMNNMGINNMNNRGNNNMRINNMNNMGINNMNNMGINNMNNMGINNMNNRGNNNMRINNMNNMGINNMGINNMRINNMNNRGNNMRINNMNNRGNNMRIGVII